MFASVGCPQCGRMLDRGVLRTRWLTVHPEQMLAALREAETAESHGQTARIFAGTATAIAYPRPRSEKLLRCLYCPDCAVVVAAREDLIVDAPAFTRFARRTLGGQTVFFVGRLRAWRLMRGVVIGALVGLACSAFSVAKGWLSSEFTTFPVVFFAALGLCWGMLFDVLRSLQRTKTLRLTQRMDDLRRAKGDPPLAAAFSSDSARDDHAADSWNSVRDS